MFVERVVFDSDISASCVDTLLVGVTRPQGARARRGRVEEVKSAVFPGFGSAAATQSTWFHQLFFFFCDVIESRCVLDRLLPFWIAIPVYLT